MYSLGSKIAVYQPGTMGLYMGKKVEMIRAFGTRWDPLRSQEIENCTAPARGLGMYGFPTKNSRMEKCLVENRALLGKYEGDGGVRLAFRRYRREIFSIVITKPAFVILVRGFFTRLVLLRHRGRSTYALMRMYACP